MTEIIERHHQTFEEVRRLCLHCYGLDLTSTQLSREHDPLRLSELSMNTLREALSTHLLRLAVAIRVNIYQENISGRHKLDQMTASLYTDPEKQVTSVTIKDVCDKIIHAVSLTKSAFPPALVPQDCRIAVQLQGFQRSNNWTLNLCVTAFAQAVLEMLDCAEADCKKRKPGWTTITKPQT